mmetsp:Transcript_39612/g.77457  ORF Transcript_39612/g.77457 Transcript_39612/m.77457 type:complete len:280 (-) Transcript_39612:270-1109(-)
MTTLLTGIAPTTLTVGLLGATGRTGGWVLEGCLEKGHKVFALVRNPDKLKAYTDSSPIFKSDSGKKGSVNAVKGDATSAVGIKSLLEAAEMDGSSLDVIISTIGSSKEVVIVKKAAEALVGALNALSTIPRIVWMTSTGINEATDQAKSYPLFGSPSRWFFGYGGFGWLQFKILIPYIIGQGLWDDMGHSEDVIRADDKVSAKTVIVRPTNMHPVSECPVFSEAWWKEGGTDEELEYVLIKAEDPPPGKWIVRRAIAAALINLGTDTSYDGAAKSLFAK